MLGAALAAVAALASGCAAKPTAAGSKFVSREFRAATLKLLQPGAENFGRFFSGEGQSRSLARILRRTPAGQEGKLLACLRKRRGRVAGIFVSDGIQIGTYPWGQMPRD